jgi:hypothetical protein
LSAEATQRVLDIVDRAGEGQPDEELPCRVSKSVPGAIATPMWANNFEQYLETSLTLGQPALACPRSAVRHQSARGLAPLSLARKSIAHYSIDTEVPEPHYL